MSLTPEQIAEINKQVAAGVAEALKTALPGALEAVTKPLTERLLAIEAAETARAEAAKVEEAKAKKADDGNVSGGAPPELVAQMRALQEELKAQQEKTKAAERAAAEDRAFGATRDALVKAGIPADRVSLALAYVKANGLVKIGEDGSHHFEGSEQFGVRPRVTPEVWAAEFVKTNEGKALLPAVESRGAGTQTVNGSAPRTKGGDVDWGALASNGLNIAALSGLG